MQDAARNRPAMLCAAQLSVFRGWFYENFRLLGAELRLRSLDFAPELCR
jgi:hypothetical protein